MFEARFQEAKIRQKFAQERKMWPTWPQHAEFTPPRAWVLGLRGLPLGRKCSMLMKAKMQWDLTRLALQAARRTWFQVGEPSGSKIEAETTENDVERRHIFDIDF